MINDKIKVAQIIGKSDGGVASVTMTYYSAIDKDKVQFDFLVEGESKIINKEKIEALGGKVIIIPSYKRPKKYMKELQRIFEENKYDIVHSNMSTLSGFSLKAAKRAGIKCRICHSHSTTSKDEIIKNILKYTLRRPSRRYATNYFACSELAGRFLFGNRLYDEGKVNIIYNAIDLKKFKFNLEARKRIREELNIENKFVVGHIGRMCPQKNQLFMIDIFDEILKLKYNSVLLFIGDGKLKDKIYYKLVEKHLENKVIFISETDKPYDYYNAMDCFVLPSLYEGLPVVGVEAQANNLPCFFSENVTSEVMQASKAFMISLKETSKNWAYRILYESNDINRLKDSYIEEYDINIQAKRLLEIYTKMIGR